MSCSCDPFVRLPMPHAPWDCRWDMTEWDADFEPDCLCGHIFVSERCPVHSYLLDVPIEYDLTEIAGEVA